MDPTGEASQPAKNAERSLRARDEMLHNDRALDGDHPVRAYDPLLNAGICITCSRPWTWATVYEEVDA